MLRLGEAVRPHTRYARRPGIYAILLRGADVLLTAQDGEDPLLQFPGGGVDRGEHPLPALHREVMEETGWTIAAPRRLGVFTRHTFLPETGRWTQKVCHMYAARPARRVGPPTEPGHHAIWMPADLAAEMLDTRVGPGFLRALLR